NRAFEYLQKNAGLSTLQLAKLRRELGDTQGALKTAMGALNTRSHSAIVSEMKDIVASYREVKNSADATANDVKRAAESMRGSLKRLASEARATKISLQSSWRLSSRLLRPFSELPSSPRRKLSGCQPKPRSSRESATWNRLLPASGMRRGYPRKWRSCVSTGRHVRGTFHAHVRRKGGGCSCSCRWRGVWGGGEGLI
ncbi:MAG: hypothetical protein ACLSAH_20855, partial [Bilophila wadsworthia]